MSGDTVRRNVGNVKAKDTGKFKRVGQSRASSGDKMRKKNGTEYVVGTWEDNPRQGRF